MSQRTEAARRARRAAARRHHPDLGGSAEEFARAMAQLDAPAPRTTGRTGRVRRWTRAARRLRRELPTHLPRRWPGAKRYGHL